MRWSEFLTKVRKWPVIETNLLIKDDPDLRVQISRWVKSNKLIQVKRGVYVLAKQYRQVNFFWPYLATILKSPSYVSLEKALEYHDLIPEGATVLTSVTSMRPGRFLSEIGVFDYRHIKPSLFWGYKSVKLNKQVGFIAEPEKALLDFFYLKAPLFSEAFVDELRLQNLENINPGRLLSYADKFRKQKIARFTKLVIDKIKHRD
jgi:predicted transcriptional regulator of viral defense system